MFLFQNSYATSRTEARRMIESGSVSVNGKDVFKASFAIVPESDLIKINNFERKYVSRGGFKLECALENFDIDIKDRLAIDVGASSGGFTDCLLQNGVRSVIALDSGSGQLVKKIRDDKRVYVIENYNARYISKSDLPYVPNLAVMDVSFISATYIIPALFASLSPLADFICLIKPQFEVGKANIGKRGIVKDEKVREEAVKKVTSFAEKIGFETVKVVKSDITGGDGNVEYLAHFKKTALSEGECV